MEILENDHLHALRIAEGLVIPHTNFALALSRLEIARAMAASGAEPRRYLLVGESGCGKTLLARYFQSKFQPEKLDGCRSKPVLYIETPATPTLKGFAEAMLMALGDPAAHRGSAFDKQNRALNLLRYFRVEFLIVDEFQHFLDHGRGGTLSTVADWFKLLIDSAQIPTLLMGLPRCEAILQANEQIRRRFSAKLELPPFSLDTEDEEDEFRAVIEALNDQLPIKMPRADNFHDAVQRIYFATGGRIGYVKKLLISALELAMLRGASYIDRPILSAAFAQEIWSDSYGELNPFDQKFAFRCLDRVGEPFYLQQGRTKNPASSEVAS